MITDHFVDCARNADGVAMGDLGLVRGKLMWRRRGRGSKALEARPVPALVLEAGPATALVLALEARPVPCLCVEVAARYLEVPH